MKIVLFVVIMFPLFQFSANSNQKSPLWVKGGIKYFISNDDVGEVKFIPNTHRLAIPFEYLTIRVYDSDNGKLISVIEKDSTKSRDVRSLAFTKDGYYAYDYELTKYDMRNYQRADLKDYDQDVFESSEMKITDDDKYSISSRYLQPIRIFDLEKDTLKNIIGDFITSFVVTSDNKILFSKKSIDSIYVYDINTDKYLDCLPIKDFVPYDLSEDDNYLICINEDFISVFDLKNNEIIRTIENKSYRNLKLININNIYLNDRTKIYKYDIEKDEIQFIEEFEDYLIDYLDISYDEKYIAIHNIKTNNVVIYNIESGNIVNILPFSSKLNSIKVKNSSSIIVSDHIASIKSVNTNNGFINWEISDNYLSDFIYSASKNLIFSVKKDDDNTLKLISYDTNNPQSYEIIDSNLTSAIYSGCFSAHDNIIATVDRNGNVNIYDLNLSEKKTLDFNENVIDIYSCHNGKVYYVKNSGIEIKYCCYDINSNIETVLYEDYTDANEKLLASKDLKYIIFSSEIIDYDITKGIKVKNLIANEDYFFECDVEKINLHVIENDYLYFSENNKIFQYNLISREVSSTYEINTYLKNRNNQEHRHIEINSIELFNNQLFAATSDATVACWEILPDGIESNVSTSEIRLCPNPVNHSANLQINVKEMSKIEFSIFDLAGNCLYKSSNNIYEKGNHNICFLVSDYISGRYFCKLLINNEVIVVPFLIKH